MKHHQCLLVIDDEVKARQAVAACLADAGHRVTVANNGLDALAAAHGDQPNAVVLDVHAPIVDCLETAEALSRNCFTSRMKIVIRSSVPEADVRALFPMCDVYVDAQSLEALVEAVAEVGGRR